MNNRDKKKLKKKSKAMKHVDFLSLLGRSKNRLKRGQLLDYAGKDEIDAIAECVFNVLQGRVPIESAKLRRLRYYKNVMRSLIDKNTPINKKKLVLKQKGGFLGAILPASIGLITSLLPELIKAVIPQRRQ